ncbi:unnamed protein product [Sphagnum troendelagicum]|uniref:RRM domain-containing protein n=1 Tax=Sphagnum troendelagicum TaxID=128251 RepID=A0ABP0U734_9BRYO
MRKVRWRTPIMMFSRGSYLGGADAYEVGAKRQRLIDGGASLLLGQPRPLPVVRLRGLPFNCSDGDVFEFFAGLDVVDVLLVRKQGRFSGEAFVVLGVPVQVEYALQKNRHNMGRRYIEVFRCKKQDYYHAVAADVADPCKRSDDLLPSRPMPPIISSVIMKPFRSGKEHLKHTGVLKLRGLPFSASKRNVIEFFRGFSLAEENVHIVVHGDGRATGEAFVEFSSTLEAKAAMNKDKMTLGSRYVEIFPSSHEEATRAAIKQR